MKISLVYKKGALKEAEAVKEKAEALGIEVLSTFALDQFSEGEEDAVIVIGGDGSFLRVASIANKPIALLRYESFGFFASCSSERAEELFETLDRSEIINLWKIEAELSKGKKALAVNEFFLKGCRHSITFDLSVKGCAGISFRGDGVIVATPSGSAGHAFSFGGPLLVGADGLVVVPVAPIRSNLHAMVFRDNSEIEIRCSDAVELVADGQKTCETDSVKIRKSIENVKLIKKESFDEKLGRLIV